MNKICSLEHNQRQDFNAKYSNFVLIDSFKTTLQLPMPKFQEISEEVDKFVFNSVNEYLFEKKEMNLELQRSKDRIIQAQHKLVDFIQKIHLDDSGDVNRLK